MNNGHHEHETNPWIVTKIQDFLYFCCPECDVREPITSKDDFFKHAIENHPKAKDYLELLIKNEPVLEVENWHFDEYHPVVLEEGDKLPITEDFYVEENGNDIISDVVGAADEDISSKLGLDSSQQESKMAHLQKSRQHCSICQKSFGKPAILRRHIATVHKGKTNNHCDSEHQNLANNGTVADLSERNFYGECAKVKEEIQNDINFEIDNIEISNISNDETTCDDLILNNVKCELKEDEFNENITEDLISEEKLSNYYKYKKPKECESCHKVFSDGACLRRHVRTVHEGMKFNCDFCEKSFSQLPNLKIHIGTVHEDGTSNKWREKYEKYRNPQECNICQKSFVDATVLRRHVKTVHEKVESQIKNVHEGSKKVNICNLCEKSFYFQSDLVSHMAFLHEQQGGGLEKEQNTKFNCEFCKKEFGRKAHLNEHLNAYHDKPKDFKCEFCDETFRKLSSLKTHCIEIHDKQKFLKCRQCGKEFAQSQSLKEHVLFVHEGIKNHICEGCGKAFGTSSVLKHHQKVVNNSSNFFIIENYYYNMIF